MIKTTAVMAWLVATMLAQAMPDTVPIGTTRSADLPPEARKTFGMDQITVVVQLTLTRGKWYVAGGSTVQLTGTPGAGWFVYTYAAFVKGNPNSLPLKSDTGLWSAPHNTYWVSNDPKSHTVVIDVDQQVVYLTVMYHAQEDVQLAQVFGSMTAVKVADL